MEEEEEQPAEKRPSEDGSPCSKFDKDMDSVNESGCPASSLVAASPSQSSFSESKSHFPVGINSDDESTTFHCDQTRPLSSCVCMDITSTQPPSLSNLNHNQLLETSEVISSKDADNNEIVLPPPQEIPPTWEVPSKDKSCPSLYKNDKSEVSSMSSSDSTEDESFGNLNRNLNDRLSHFLWLERIPESETESEFSMVAGRDEVRRKRLKLRRSSSSSLLLTVHVTDSHLKYSDLESSSSLFEIQEKLEYELEDSESQESDDTCFLQNFSQIPTTLYDRRFRVAWKMSDLYHRNKKATVDTPIPLTGTSMFTQRISFCKRFCRRLKSSSFCCCFSRDSTLDGLTRQESIEAFHNEIQGLGADERPEGSIGSKRRGNLIGATKSMKLVQKLHNCDKPLKKRVSR